MARPRTDIVIRGATARDELALRRLAALDDARAPQPGPDVLIAEVDGLAVAAVAGDRVIADPFRPTAAIVELLRLRASQLASAAPAGASPQGSRAELRPHAPVSPRPLPLG